MILIKKEKKVSLTATLSPYTLQGKLTSNRTPGKAWGESMRMAGRKEKLNYLPLAIISVFSLFMCNLNGSIFAYTINLDYITTPPSPTPPPPPPPPPPLPLLGI
ncbi:hypothetical protein GQX74_004434 [Glossina fuscipes]|nr:hypothetical protein GQX74_004434 [Glossina fuscipes]